MTPFTLFGGIFGPAILCRLCHAVTKHNVTAETSNCRIARCSVCGHATAVTK
jgi:hypothetical protein